MVTIVGRSGLCYIVLLISFIMASPSLAESEPPPEPLPLPASCAELREQSGILWYGSRPTMSYEQLASYVGPILMFSADEPLLDGKKGPDMRIPEAFPFEEVPDAPVVYYRVTNLLVERSEAEEAVTLNEQDRNQSILHLDKIQGIDLDYFFYYSSEEGVGHHPHDVESTEFKIEVIQMQESNADSCRYALRLHRVIAKAHGIVWFDNTLVIEDDQEISLPMSIFVEEGKHASCTDRNGDGVYSPGFDVNRRINDAWGVRDVIRSGSLITGHFQGWMAKARRPNYMVVPPLPQNSPLYPSFARDKRELPNKAVYKLRPYPSAESAKDDKGLYEKIADKGSPEWPKMIDSAGEHAARYFHHEPFLKSIGVSYRYDGDHGISFAIPLLIVKNVELPVIGGWLVHRPYIRKLKTGDFGLSLLYTPSASRWIDPYVAMGAESNATGGGVRDWAFMFETGMRFRVNLAGTFLKPITKVTTPLWGLRAGIRNLGFADIDRLTFVIEVGAGVW